jgi:putative aminopeptidase FrvX
MAQRVMMLGEDLPGMFGIPKPTHILTDEERKRVLELKDFYIDIGLPAAKVKELVRVGDWVTMWQDMVQVGDLYSSKTMDDRVGVWVMLEALRAASRTTADIYAVASVQEEVGLRGAQISAFGIAPTVGLALDVTGVPGIAEQEHVTVERRHRHQDHGLVCRLRPGTRGLLPRPGSPAQHQVPDRDHRGVPGASSAGGGAGYHRLHSHATLGRRVGA